MTRQSSNCRLSLIFFDLLSIPHDQYLTQRIFQISIRIFYYVFVTLFSHIHCALNMLLSKASFRGLCYFVGLWLCQFWLRLVVFRSLFCWVVVIRSQSINHQLWLSCSCLIPRLAFIENVFPFLISRHEFSSCLRTVAWLHWLVRGAVFICLRI